MTASRNLCSRWSLFVLSLIWLLPVSSCVATEHSEAAGPEDESPSEGWRTYRDPMGFSLEIPGDWDVEGDPETGQVWLFPPADTEVVIWPVFISRPIEPREAGRTEQALLSKLGYDEGWSEPRSVEQTTVRSVMQTQDGETGVAMFSWVPTPVGTSGTLYLISGSSDDELSPSEETIVHVLASFRLARAGRLQETGRSGGEPVSGAGTRWVDPTERAFSVELEPGWQANGGVVRPNSILTQAKIEAFSPDEEIYLYFGDTFPWFIEPNQFLGPGQTYHDPMGGSSPVWYYLPGGRFVTQYLLPQRYGAFEIVREIPQPQMAERLLRIGINEYQAGIVRFRFQREGKPFEGSAFCITERLHSGGFASWHVYRLALVEATSGRIRDGEAALAHLVGSFRIDPQWLQREAIKAGVNSQIIAEMSRTISATVSAAFENQQRRTEHALNEGAKARRGIEEVEDPLTGETFEVSSGSNYYWIDAKGRIIGTETATIPNIDFRPMFIRH